MIQETIHKLEVAGGMRYVKIGLSILFVLVVSVLYNLRDYHNFSNQESMDAAQVARNLAQGKGYATDFIRPFSMYLVRKNNEREMSGARLAELSRIRGTHPDIANPPVYPAVLAGLMKILPFNFSMPLNKGFWSLSGAFWRSQPDFLISLFNQLLFLLDAIILLFLARRLFDPMTAWLSAALFFGTEIFWRFSISGLSTMLLLLIFLGLGWMLVLLEEHVRSERTGSGRVIALAIAAGVLTGLGCLTRYSFGWLIVPVIVFLLIFGGLHRPFIVPAAVVAFALVVTPWIVRNYKVSDTPFGTASYAIFQDTFLFPQDTLERSLEPDLHRPSLNALTQKLILNTRQVLQEDVPKLGGNWVSAFFLVGLLVSFATVGASRLRYFVLLCLAVLVLVQAMGRTYLSTDSPEVNSENLLVLLAPLALVFAVSFFLLLLNQIYLPIRELRYLIIGLFCVAACLPMIFAFLPPRKIPLAAPPYRPNTAHIIGGWAKPDELITSDIPWAVAWYGQHQCVWTPAETKDFIELNTYYKPVSIAYLTERSSEKFGTAWSILIIENLLTSTVPEWFPLKHSPPHPPRDPENPADLFGAQVVLTDIDRWRF